MLAPLFVMHVNSGATLIFPFECRHPGRRTSLVSFIVTYGPLPSLVSLVTNIIWLYLRFASHYLWTFPLRLKSDTYDTLANFFSYVTTQFGATVKAVQCDNGREFDNSSARTFFLTHGTHLRMSCPYTSPQNGRAERIIRSVNDILRSLLFQASLPPSY